jgi:general secretion pathway protein N
VARPGSPAVIGASWGLAWTGAAVGLVFAVVLFAPARWLADGLGRATQGRVLLDEPRGTVWNGSARLILTGGADSNDAAALPGRVTWHLRAAWNGLRADIDASCCTPQPVALAITPRWGGAALALADGSSQWPAALLAGLGTPWNTLQVDGDLQLATQGLSIEWAAGRLTVAGRAELAALRLSSRLSTLKPMGSYRVTLTGGPSPALRLETLEGALQLSGDGQWIASRLRFSGSASAAPDREAALSNLLNIIGRRSGSRSIITIG